MRRFVIASALVLTTVVGGTVSAFAATSTAPAATTSTPSANSPQGICPVYPLLSYNNGSYWVGVACAHFEVP